MTRHLLPLFVLATLGFGQAQEVLPPPIRYNALSNAAEASGQLAYYKNASSQTVRLQVGDSKLVAQVPRMVRAYDVVPIPYTLTTKGGGVRQTAVVATAFEDTSKTKGRQLYDLNVPGNMDVKIDYLGSVSSNILKDKYIPLTPDAKSPISPFPIYTRDPLVRSGEVRAADLVWYKWKITNTGDTILDPEGFSACFGQPQLTKLDNAGKDEWTANAVNIYVRFLNYLYPGESTEVWTLFYAPKHKEISRFQGLEGGDYRLDFSVAARLYRTYHWGVNIWGGTEIARLSVLLKATEKGGQQTVKETFTKATLGDQMPGYIESFEEFMSSFNIQKPTEKGATTNGVIYLQVAPWTKNINLKLVLDQPSQISVASVPVQNSSATMAIKYNPANPLVVDDQPAFFAQAMPGMRSGAQLGPNIVENLEAEIREMKALGVNAIVNTAGDWGVPEIGGDKNVNIFAAQETWYFDVLARREKMKLVGWSVYPPDSSHRYGKPAEAILGKPVHPGLADSRYSQPGTLIDLGSPIVPEVIAAWALFNYHRWGDLWYKTRDGVTIIDIEDTRGWQRDDINTRYPVGPKAIKLFQGWVKDRYQTIEVVNQAWGSSFTAFDQIDPQAEQGSEDNNPTIKPVYNVATNVFHDWNKAVEDWDVFRTWLRMDNYAKALQIVRKEIPNAQFQLRTEGSNMVVPGDGQSGSFHLRHIYYSQRRAGMISDQITKDGIIGFHSDYTTLPYSLQELTDATREMVNSGVRPAYLPAFCDMRDIVLNQSYGRQYEKNYALAEPTKGVMIHCLGAAYPFWKIVYEAGGAPGVIWSDFLCDAFVTDTQKRELGLLTQQFRQMKRQ